METYGISVTAPYTNGYTDISSHPSFNSDSIIGGSASDIQSFKSQYQSILQQDNISSIVDDIESIVNYNVFGGITPLDILDYATSTNPLTFALKQIGKKILFKYASRILFKKNGTSSLRFNLSSNSKQKLSDNGMNFSSFVNFVRVKNDGSTFNYLNRTSTLDSKMFDFFEIVGISAGFTYAFYEGLNYFYDLYKKQSSVSTNGDSTIYTHSLGGSSLVVNKDGSSVFLDNTGSFPLTVASKDILSNSVASKIITAVNGDITLETEQELSLDFTRPLALPRDLIETLNDKASVYPPKIQQYIRESNDCYTNYLNEPSTLTQWKWRTYQTYENGRLVTKRKWESYQVTNPQKTTYYNCYVGNHNKAIATKKRRFDDIL